MGLARYPVCFGDNSLTQFNPISKTSIFSFVFRCPASLFVYPEFCKRLPVNQPSSSCCSRVARLRSTSLQQIGGTGSASRQVTARKKRKRGYFKRLKLGKLIGQATHFIPGGGLLT